MALATYMQRLQRILGDTAFQRYNPYDLIAYINEGRNQIATEGECIRFNGTLSTVNATESYLHTAIGALPTGVSGVMAIWSITYSTPTPPLLLEGRSWPYFNQYFRTLAQPTSGTPAQWAQYQQGTAGSFFIAPVPNGIYPLVLDCVGEPLAIAKDADPESINYPWTDAIPYYAAQLALRSEGVFDIADQMYATFETYMQRARGGVTPGVQPGNYPGDWRSRRGLPAMAPVVSRGNRDFPPMSQAPQGRPSGF